MVYDSPDEGCDDLNYDRICDDPYPIYGGLDYDQTPYIYPNGWIRQKTQYGGSPIFRKSFSVDGDRE
jgi:hypothetical protein